MAFADLFNKNSAANAALLLEQQLKRGKSPAQCQCIDFFLQSDEPAQKKGCLSKKSSAWTIDDYLKHIDSMVNALNLKQRAIAKIGLDESQISEIPPIYLASFQRSDYSKSSPDYTRYVTNKYSVTWIFFSATQLYTYTYTLDTTSDNVTEFTRDFFYSDITCIRTEHEVEEVIYEIKGMAAGCKGCLKKAPENKYQRNHRHWDTLQITVPNDSYSFCCRTTNTLEQSIQAAKAMIREKK